jgi:hypothetical protein
MLRKLMIRTLMASLAFAAPPFSTVARKQPPLCWKVQYQRNQIEGKEHLRTSRRCFHHQETDSHTGHRYLNGRPFLVTRPEPWTHQ